METERENKVESVGLPDYGFSDLSCPILNIVVGVKRNECLKQMNMTSTKEMKETLR